MTLWKQISRSIACLKQGAAHRVIFYYVGEEPTYLDEVYVYLFRNGVVEIEHRNEHVSTHIQNVEILWKSQKPFQGSSSRSLRLVKPEINKSPSQEL